MEKGRIIARGFIWSTIDSLIKGGYGFISVPILLAYFGKTNYGLIGIAMAVNAYMRFVNLGLNNTNIRYFSNWLAQKEFQKVRKLFQSCLAFYSTIGLINTIVLLITAYFSNVIFSLTEEQYAIMKNLLYILSVTSFVDWATYAYDQLIKANELVGWSSMISLVSRLLMIIVLLFTVYFRLSIETYFALTCLCTITILPFFILKIKKTFAFVSFKPYFYWNVFKLIIPYSVNIFSFAIFKFSVDSLQPVVLGIRGSIDSVADLKVIGGIIAIISVVGGSFTNVFLPSASKVVADGNVYSQDNIAFIGTKFVSIILCFCAFGIMSIAPELMTIYVGKGYLDIIIWLDLWIIAILGKHNQALSSLMFAHSDHLRPVTYMTIFSSLICVVLYWFLTPYLMLGGIVIGYLAYSFLQLLFYYIYYYPKILGVKSLIVLKQSVLPYIITGFVCAIPCRYWSFGWDEWPALLVKGSLFAIAYLSAMLILLSKDEIKLAYRSITLKF